MKKINNPFLSEDSETNLNPGELGESLKHDLAEYLEDLLNYRMPFGRFEGWRLDHLPYEYLHWFPQRGGGFPSGRLGELMEFVHQTKAVGAEAVFAELDRLREKAASEF